MLTEKEKSILDTKNTSAIIQLVGKDKEPVLSFLEPVVKKVPSSNTSQNIPTASPLLPEKDQILSLDKSCQFVRYSVLHYLVAAG